MRKKRSNQPKKKKKQENKKEKSGFQKENKKGSPISRKCSRRVKEKQLAEKILFDLSPFFLILLKVVQYSAFNLMNAANLAVVFAPNMFRSEAEESPEVILGKEKLTEKKRKKKGKKKKSKEEKRKQKKNERKRNKKKRRSQKETEVFLIFSPFFFSFFLFF